MTIYGLVVRDPIYATLRDAAGVPSRMEQDLMAADLAALGVAWVRLEFHIRGDDLAGALAPYDYLLNEALPQRGIRVLGLLGFGLIAAYDPLALGEPPFEQDATYGGGVNAAMRTWLHRARVVVERFGRTVAAWEILNEPNRITASGQGLPAALVARLTAKFARFFRHEDYRGEGWRDAAVIVLGGLHPAGTHAPRTPAHVSDLEYLDQLYVADATEEYQRRFGRPPFDAVGYHPYPHEIRASSLARSATSDEAVMTSRMTSFAARLARYDPHRPIWLTEIGYNAGYARQGREGQARAVERWLPILGTFPTVAAVFWFKWEDFAPYTGAQAQLWGLVRAPEGAHGALYLSPAHAALRAALAASELRERRGE